MKKRVLIAMLMLIFILVHSSLVWGIQQAEIEEGKSSMAYSVQKINGQINALNLEGDIGLTPTLGLDAVFTYLDENDDILDLNVKIKIIDDYDFNLTGLIGYHTRFNESGKRQIGMLISKKQAKYLNLNAGFNALLDQPDNSLGYEFGFDYLLSESWFLEVGFKKIAGEDDTSGLNLGLRNYL